MANLDLTSREWCELVFQGKNKEYGAYEMRQSSPKRHNKAMIIVSIIALIVLSLPILMKIVVPEQRVSVQEVTALADLKALEEVKKEEIKVEAPPPPPLKSSIQFTPPVIKEDKLVNDEQEIKTQEEVTKSNVTISSVDVKGDDNAGKLAVEVQQVTQAVEEEKPYQTVEQMPEYPGGESELFGFIKDNLKYPVIAQENGIQGRVIVRFVVSRSGEISDVQVVRPLDPSCDKEAMRVVKKMPKWIPGRQNGKNVPVYFTLPVLFKLQ